MKRSFPQCPTRATAVRSCTQTYIYVYDSTGDLLQVTDPLGNVTKYTYDVYGNQLTETKPDGETTQNVYNNLDQLYRTIDYDGQVTQYVYDSQGNQSEVEYFQNLAQANSGTPTYTVSYTYNALGQLVSVDDPRIGITTYVYNAEGLLTDVDNPEADLHYTYDVATGNLLSISTNSTDLQYTYDVMGNLTSTTAVELNGQTLTTPLATTYTYTATGLRQSETLPNGEEVTYAYDRNGNLTQEINRDAAGDLLSEYDYVNDANGDRLQATETTLEADGTLSKTVINYTYDALGRLTEEQFAEPHGRSTAVQLHHQLHIRPGGQPPFDGDDDVHGDGNGQLHVQQRLRAAGTDIERWHRDDVHVRRERALSSPSRSTGKRSSSTLTICRAKCRRRRSTRRRAPGETQVTTTTYYYDNDGNKVRTEYVDQHQWRTGHDHDYGLRGRRAEPEWVRTSAGGAQRHDARRDHDLYPG